MFEFVCSPEVALLLTMAVLCLLALILLPLAGLNGAEKASKEHTFDLVAHLERQYAFSRKTFGPGERTNGVLQHIRKELDEIESDPDDLIEWIDLILLSCDGALRRGFTPEQICEALRSKLDTNMQREWPDWRTQPKDQPIEHVRTADERATRG